MSNDEWWESISAITEKLETIMVRVWPGEPRYPGAIELYSLAVRLQVRRTSLSKMRKQQPARISPLLTAAKKFHKEICEEKAFIFRTVPTEVHDWYSKDLTKLENAAKAVEAVIATYKPRPSYNPTAHIADDLRAAWSKVGKRLPLGVKPDEPVCLAVTAILSEIGESRSTQTVSEFLRGRSDRRRSGAPRGGREIGKKMPSEPLA